MMASPVLPICGSFSHRLLGFLDEHFRQPDDLSMLQSLLARLMIDREQIDSDLVDLNKKLSLAMSAWISRSAEVGRILNRIGSYPSPSRDGNLTSHRKILSVDLPLLAKEVGRIQSVRFYAESVLRLEALVGDLEDTTLLMMKHVSREKLGRHLTKVSRQETQDEIGWRLEKLLVAVKAMGEIEEVLLSAASSRPCWMNLLKAVDCRVEKALAILRPQSLTDYRILLVSLGWPPSLSTSNVEKDNCLYIPNPLVVMQGEMKDRYSRSFLALCYLQQVQAKREACLHFLSRKQMGSRPSDVKDIGEESFFKNGLWPIDELVSSLALRMEHHFSRWMDQPKFIFALVYKVTKNFLDGIENVLQPLIDRARFTGCSAKEAWLVAMVRLLSDYLERQIFPALTRIHSSRNGDLEISSSFLHMVDLMISFDKRIQILLTSGTHFMESFAVIEGLPKCLSIMSIFIGHFDWLKIWAETELSDAESKLRSQMEDERSWMAVFCQQAESACEKEESFLLSSREDYKAPLIADSVVQITWSIIERGLILPSRQIRNQFISSSAKLFLNHFFDILLQRSRDVEFNTAILDDAQLLRICSSMNTAHYWEQVLIEWSDDVKFMEIATSENDTQKSFFDDEIIFLVKLQTNCLEEIVTALLVYFDYLSWNYVQDGDAWEMKQVDFGQEIIEEDNLCISPSFIEVLDMLRDRLWLLKLNLNSKDFLDLWRCIAGGLDHFIFSSIPMSNAKFSSLGVYQFKTDIKALFLIFRSFCARPEAFFPCISNSLKLLTMDRKDADQLLKILIREETRSEESLHLLGVLHVSLAQAEKILKNRMIGGSATLSDKSIFTE